MQSAAISPSAVGIGARKSGGPDRVPTSRRPDWVGRSQIRAARACERSPREGLHYLEADERANWDALVEISPQGSLFCKSWWLEALGGEIRILGYYESGRLIAGIPLYFERRMGVKVCRMPQLTQTWGVVIEPLPGKRVNAAAHEMKILGTFARRLAEERAFIQSFHPSNQNWLPFYWNGFTQTTRFTYVIDDLQDLGRVWDGLEQNSRTKIRKAQRLGLGVKKCGPEAVFNASLQSFERQNKHHPYTREQLERLFDSARENDAGECFAAVDPEGGVHDAVLLVWDSKRTYFLAGGGDSNLRNSGGGSLLVWHCLQFAASRSRIFDFEGSMLEPVESFFRSFGATQVAYNRIMKFPAWLRAGLCLAGKM